MAEWQRIAGDIQVDWALEHREEIARRRPAAQGRHRARHAVVDGADVDSDATTDLAHGLVARLAELRKLGTQPARASRSCSTTRSSARAAVKPSLLELLGRAVGTRRSSS